MKFSVLILFIALFACKNNKPSGSVQKDEIGPAVKEEISKIKTDSTKDSTRFRLVVKFFSIGEGAENEFINAFEDSIGGYSAFYIGYRQTECYFHNKCFSKKDTENP